MIVCTNPPKSHPALVTILWNLPLTTTMFFSAGPHCTLPFPELKAGELSRTGRCGARSGPADESEPRPRPLRTTYTVGTVTVLALSATSCPFTPQPPSPVSPPPNRLPYSSVWERVTASRQPGTIH